VNRGRAYTEDQLRKILNQEISKAGSQKNFADANNLARSHVSDVVAGKRQVGGKLLKVLGFVESPRTFHKNGQHD
jgi:hypothetical protein